MELFLWSSTRRQIYAFLIDNNLGPRTDETEDGRTERPEEDPFERCHHTYVVGWTCAMMVW
jgi:hypothetical protein